MSAEKVTFMQWLAGRPFERLPSEEEARRLEQAFTAGLRFGRESAPPVAPLPFQPGPEGPAGYVNTQPQDIRRPDSRER